MDSKNQLAIFCLCVAAGFFGGLFYEIVAFLRLLFGCERGKNKMLGGALDIVFYLFLAIVYIFTAFLFEFPSFRAYTWLGFALGGVLYLKTLRQAPPPF